MSNPENTQPIQPIVAEPHWQGWQDDQAEHEHDLPIYNQARTAPQPVYQPAPQPQYIHAFPQQGFPQQGIQQVVNVSGLGQKRCRHGLHFVLTILTAGLWLPVWIIDALAKGK
jgi:hypothetical protein